MNAAKYGNRNVPKMIRQVDALRHAIAAEGSPAIQAAWDAVEEHIDYAYRRDDAGMIAEAVAKEREACAVVVKDAMTEGEAMVAGTYNADPKNKGNARYFRCAAIGHSRKGQAMSVRLLTHNGETDTVKGWSVRTGISVSCLNSRLSYGWAIEKALTRAMQKNKRRNQQKITEKGKQ
ncbi:MAG: hypothetical protein U5N55_05045 [Cypionkella sp.]|nr:hypothetical protein [Cypionkella sp.]